MYSKLELGLLLAIGVCWGLIVLTFLGVLKGQWFLGLYSLRFALGVPVIVGIDFIRRVLSGRKAGGNCP